MCTTLSDLWTNRKNEVFQKEFRVWELSLTGGFDRICYQFVTGKFEHLDSQVIFDKDMKGTFILKQITDNGFTSTIKVGEVKAKQDVIYSTQNEEILKIILNDIAKWMELLITNSYSVGYSLLYKGSPLEYPYIDDVGWNTPKFSSQESKDRMLKLKHEKIGRILQAIETTCKQRVLEPVKLLSTYL